MRRVYLVLFSVALLAIAICPQAAQAQTIRAPGDYAPTVFPGNDDSSVGPVNIGFTVDYYGLTTSTLFVNNNGNVTFTSSLGTFTPFDLTSTATPIIAPFFADVDTRGAASGLVNYGNGTVNGRPAFLVNWPTVGYFPSATDKLNTFQLVIINRSDRNPSDFDFEFNYAQIQWETGSASGGTGGLGGNSARAGFSNGSGDPGTFFEIAGSALPGSFLDTNAVTGLINASNIGVPGRFLFIVQNGIVVIGPNPDSQDASLPLPRIGVAAMMGNGWSALDATMDVARNYRCDHQRSRGDNAGEPSGDPLPVCAFAIVSGSRFDTDEAEDTELMGTAGLQWQPFSGVRLGAAFHVAHPGLDDILYRGDIDMWSRSLSAFASYTQGRTGLQASAIAMAGKSDFNIKRTYVVGATPETTTADSDGTALGYLLQAGWAMALPVDGTTIMPFAQYGSLRGRMNGYTESGGQYPAIYDDINDRSRRSKLGAELRFEQPRFGAWLSAAWVHEFSPRDADVHGLVQVQQSTFNYAGIVRDDNWAEIALGARTQPLDGLTFVGSATASVGTDTAPDFSFRIGANIQLQ